MNFKDGVAFMHPNRPEKPTEGWTYDRVKKHEFEIEKLEDQKKQLQQKIDDLQHEIDKLEGKR